MVLSENIDASYISPKRKQKWNQLGPHSLCFCLENQIVIEALSRPNVRVSRRTLSENLSSFIPAILHNPSQYTDTNTKRIETDTRKNFEFN